MHWIDFVEFSFNFNDFVISLSLQNLYVSKKIQSIMILFLKNYRLSLECAWIYS